MAGQPVKLVLASASPRRLMLLERMGLAPDLLNPTDLDETPKRRETPRRLSIRLAEEKAKAAIHAPQVQGFFHVPTDHLLGAALLSDHLARTRDLSNTVLVAGDAPDSVSSVRCVDLGKTPIDLRLAGSVHNSKGDDRQTSAAC